MKSENFLSVAAVISVIMLILSFGVAYYSVSSFKHNFLTGFATTSNGTILINITSAVSINFTTDSIDWGIGRVSEGTTQAVLDTGNSANPVINGTDWTSVTQGFILENIGNLNASISLKTGKTAATFIGGTGANYTFNVTNSKPGSCPTGNQVAFGNNVDVSTTGTTVCSRLQFLDSADTLRIDIRLVVPYNAPISTTTTKSDQMQATASAAS